MNKGKLAGIIICGILCIAIIALLICNWTGAFADIEPISPYTGEDIIILNDFSSWQFTGYKNYVKYNVQYTMMLKITDDTITRPYPTSLEMIYSSNGQTRKAWSLPLSETSFSYGAGYFGFYGIEYTIGPTGQPESKPVSTIYDYEISLVTNDTAAIINAGNANATTFAFKGVEYAYTVGSFPSGQSYIDFRIYLGSKYNDVDEYIVTTRMTLKDNALGTTENVKSLIPYSPLGQRYGQKYIPNIPQKITDVGNWEAIRQEAKYGQQQYNSGYNTGYEESEAKLKQPLNTAATLLKTIATAFDIKIFGFLSIIDIIGIGLVVGLIFLILNIIRG